MLIMWYDYDSRKNLIHYIFGYKRLGNNLGHSEYINSNGKGFSKFKDDWRNV